jgi:type IV secretory pathway VirB4 component
MVNLPKFLKQHRAAGAANAVLAPHRFIDEHVFLTKGNQLGIALAVQGIDCECLTDDALDSYTKRAVQAWRIFDDRFRVYQYVLKQDRASIEYAGDYGPEIIRKTISDRNAHLQSKAPGLYTLRLVYVILLERSPMYESSRVKRALSTKKVLRVFADSLEHSRATLVAQTDSFIPNIGDVADRSTQAYKLVIWAVRRCNAGNTKRLSDSKSHQSL